MVRSSKLNEVVDEYLKIIIKTLNIIGDKWKKLWDKSLNEKMAYTGDLFGLVFEQVNYK